MSGIAGIVHFRGETPDREQVQQLSNGIAHRGPSDKSLVVEGPAAMAFRRFSTRRRQTAQPLTDGPLWLACDGPIFSGTVEGILSRWQAAGTQSLGDISGEFALAVWDGRQRALWLARDATGSRPMFWTRRAGQVAFCSELPPLLRLPWVSRELAVDNLSEYLSFRYVHAPRTLLQDVYAVPPGHVLRIDSSGEHLERWWRPPWSEPGSAQPDEQRAAGHLDRLLSQSVERRLQGDEPVGLLLSGGLDSSAILHHAVQHTPDLPTFTVALSEGVDESPFAARVARVMGAPHHLIRVSDRQFVDALTEATTAMGQPMPTAAGAVQKLLFSEIRRHVRVILSGDGGDELLGGRGMDQIAWRLKKSQLVGRLPGPARLITRGLARKVQLNDWSAPTSEFGMNRAIGGSRVFHSAERVTLLADPGMVRPGIRRTVLEPLYQEIDSSPLNNILHVWQRGWLPEDGLARSDRMAASSGLQVRYPMLDPELLSYAAGLPDGVKVHRRRTQYITKWLLRQAMTDRLPRQLLHRPKRSLPNPLSHWLRGPGSDFLAEQVDAICEYDADLFMPSVIRRLATEHRTGAKSHGLRLWTLILFRIWRGML